MVSRALFLVLFGLLQFSISEDADVISQKCTDYRKLFADLPNRGWDYLNFNDSKEVIFIFNDTKCDEYFLPYRESYNARLITVTAFNNPIAYVPLKVFGLRDNPMANCFLPNCNRRVYEDLRRYYEVIGSFNEDFLETKKELIEQKAIILRTELRVPLFEIKFDVRKLTLNPAFVSDLMGLTRRFVGNEDELLAYEADEFIQKYGTDYVSSAKYGGVIAIEDFIPRKLINLESAQDKQRLFDLAENVFVDRLVYLKSESSNDEEIDAELLKNITKYTKMVTKSRYYILGGNPADVDRLTLPKWNESLKDNPVIIERRVTKISNTNLLDHPTIPRQFSTVLSSILDDAMKRYIEYNTHHGCTNSASRNFNLAANHDDRSCGGDVIETKYFGGIFQSCTESPSIYNFCEEFRVKNPSTHEESCPDGYETVEIRSKVVEKYVNVYEKHECARKFILAYHYGTFACVPSLGIVNINYRSFWCKKTSQNPTSGILFGGIYTSLIPNPNTGLKTCPDGYKSIKFYNEVYICVGLTDRSNSVAFGGMYICAFGNPLSKFDKCPTGFNAHAIYKDDRGCSLTYCASYLNAGKRKEFPTLVIPSSRPRPDSREIETETLVLVNGRSIYYRNTVDENWKMAFNVSQLEKFGLLKVYDALVKPLPTPKLPVTTTAGSKSTRDNDATNANDGENTETDASENEDSMTTVNEYENTDTDIYKDEYFVTNMDEYENTETDVNGNEDAATRFDLDY